MVLNKAPADSAPRYRHWYETRTVGRGRLVLSAAFRLRAGLAAGFSWAQPTKCLENKNVFETVQDQRRRAFRVVDFASSSPATPVSPRISAWARLHPRHRRG